MQNNQKKRILVIEDDPDIARLVQLQMKDHSFFVDIANSGTDGFEKARSGEYALLIVDIMLPGMDGLEICRRLRAQRNFVPILILTSRSDEVDKILGLEIGADDYLTKPFNVRELVARVKALCRRVNEWPSAQDEEVQEEIRAGKLCIDISKRRVLLGSDEVGLTAKEYELLVLLASSPGRVFSREHILALIWNYDSTVYEHTVTSHINRLRNKIEDDPSNPVFLLTEWGVGYRFTDKLQDMRD